MIEKCEENALDPKTQRRESAEKIVNKYILLSGGAGLIPVPLFDQVSIAAIQAKMVYDLGQNYNVEIATYRVRAIILSILGGAHSQWITRYIMGYLTMFVPGINVVGTLITRPALAGAITYTIGKIFIKQFENGATLESFDTEQARNEFAEHFKEGERFVRDQSKKAEGDVAQVSA
ncbi:MAG: YcjF family protein [Pseudomonadota bacterium]